MLGAACMFSVVGLCLVNELQRSLHIRSYARAAFPRGEYPDLLGSDISTLFSNDSRESHSITFSF